MSEEMKKREVPLPAVTALLTCVFGFVYCLNLRDLFEKLHWYSFAGGNNLSYEGFQSLLTYYGIALFVYYVMFLVLSCRIFLQIDQHITAVLVVMVSARLTAIGLMFAAGTSMLFQFGFEAFLELVALTCLILLRKGIRRNGRLFDSRFTVGIIAVLAEMIFLLRHFQFLFVDDIHVLVRISLILLPVMTAVTFFSFTLRAMEPYRPLPPAEEAA